jgi:hypothetical protein
MNTSFHLKYTRQALGIFILFMGTPLIFFFKEVLGFGGGSTFTLVSYGLGLILMISPDDIFKKFYKPNLPLYRLAAIYMGVIIFNYFFANPYWGWSGDRSVFYRDLGNYILIFGFFFMLLSVSNEVKEYFIPIVVALTFFGSICLIYSMKTNPNFVIGQRASVVFGDGSTTASGNPHVYARNAFGGIFGSYIMLKSKSTLWRIFSLCNIVLSGVVLILTQARSILLAFIFTMVVFVYYNVSTKSIKNGIVGIFKPQNLILIVLLVSGVVYFISTQGKLVSIINMYYDAFLGNFTKALLTASGQQDAKTIDYSSLGRVNNFTTFKKILFEEPYNLILGKGYRYLYMDIPILEPLIDCGIIAFLSFGMMAWVMFKEAIKAIKKEAHPFTTFLGYFFMCYFVTLATGGEPYGIAYWFIFCVMIRFLGIKYLTNVQSPSQKTVPVTPTVISA